MVCWKLVRDGLVEELRRRGARVFRVADAELEALLRAKIVEEALELAETGDPAEAADLIEALAGWLRVRGVAWERVEGLRRLKRAERGGFGGFVAVWDC